MRLLFVDERGINRSMIRHDARQGDVVRWDTSVRPRAFARWLIENAGASVFRPSYSCGTNPIELAWSKVKMSLGTHAAKARETLVDAVADALSQVITSDMCHGFETCGEHAQQQGKPF